MAVVVSVHRFEAKPSAERMNAVARKIDLALVKRGARWLRSYESTDGCSLLCEFEAADANVVIEACRLGGAPVTEAWVAKRTTLEECEAEQRAEDTAPQVHA